MVGTHTGRLSLSKAMTQPKLRILLTSKIQSTVMKRLHCLSIKTALQSCNEGWLWGHDYRPALVWASSNETLRRWGWVFWDKERYVVYP